MRLQHRLALVIATLLAALVFPATAFALVPPMSLDRLSILADTVVEARVVSVTASQAAADAPIMTRVTIQALQRFKGAGAATFSFEQPGGTVGDLTLEVPELATFTPGETCVLFLDSHGVVGAYRGKLAVEGASVPSLSMSLSELRSRVAEASLRGASSAPAQAPADKTAAVASALGISYLVPSAAPNSLAAQSPAPLAPPAPNASIDAAVALIDSTFEGPSTTGWTFSGNPTWGTSAYRAATGTYSLYGTASGTLGVAAPGPAPVGAYAIAQRSSAVNLSSYNYATLGWDVWTGLTSDSTNWVNVQLATSATGPWYTPDTTFASGSSGGWVHYSVDLRSVTDAWSAGTTQFTGQPAVYVRLVFYHGVGAADEGAYVDNVKLAADNIVTPTITSISPTSANAGVGDTITITGSGFGATRGTGKVEFLNGRYQDGTRVPVTAYTSWSDTQIVCAVPRYAESGSVWVTADSAVSSTPYTYTVGYSTDGRTWPSLPVTYLINENTPDVVGEGAAIQAAFATWNSAGSNFRLAYGGTTTTSGYPTTYDGHNDIYFTTDPDFPTGPLAMNSYWMSGSTILESDITFADSYSWAIGAVVGRYDIETIALHELGHGVGLDDQYGDMSEAMGAGQSNSTRRTLSPYDAAGAIHLYGGDATAPPDAPLVSSATHPVDSTWYSNAAPTLTFSATGVSGVAGYSYVMNQVAATTPDTTSEGSGTSASYSGLANGEWWFHVRAVSPGGTWGATTHFRVRIDTTPPTTTASVPASGTGSVQFTLSASDALSGVSQVRYRIDGGATQTYSAPVTVTTVGTHTLSYWSVDAAGNTETPGDASFEVIARDEIDVLAVQGTDRFTTAVETSKLGFPGGAGTVLIATGRNWPDALGASGLAGALDAPILLTEKDFVPAAVSAEIARLGATHAIVIGGTGAVSNAVQSALGSIGSISSVERISGDDRYDTARRVALRAVSEAGATYDGTVLIATGGSYADALAASPAAAANAWPILLVAPGQPMPAATLTLAEDIGSRAVILGGTAAVATSVESQMTSYFGYAKVTRIAGTDRFDTASKAAVWAVANAGLDFAHPAIATGRSPYDALAGGVVQGSDGSVLLLTEPTVLPATTSATLHSNENAILEVRFLGGTGAVSQGVRDSVATLLGIP